jgi:transcriptional regulator with XRE-family HTH domain
MATFRFNGAELKRRRHAAGLTVGQLADQVGRCHASISHYENDFSVPPTAALLRLSTALQCEPGVLFSPVREETPEAAMT